MDVGPIFLYQSCPLCPYESRKTNISQKKLFENRHFNLATFVTETYIAQWTASYIDNHLHSMYCLMTFLCMAIRHSPPLMWLCCNICLIPNDQAPAMAINLSRSQGDGQSLLRKRWVMFSLAATGQEVPAGPRAGTSDLAVRYGTVTHCQLVLGPAPQT